MYALPSADLVNRWRSVSKDGYPKNLRALWDFSQTDPSTGVVPELIGGQELASTELTAANGYTVVGGALQCNFADTGNRLFTPDIRALFPIAPGEALGVLSGSGEGRFDSVVFAPGGMTIKIGGPPGIGYVHFFANGLAGPGILVTGTPGRGAVIYNGTRPSADNGLLGLGGCAVAPEGNATDAIAFGSNLPADPLTIPRSVPVEFYLSAMASVAGTPLATRLGLFVIPADYVPYSSSLLMEMAARWNLGQFDDYPEILY